MKENLTLKERKIISKCGGDFATLFQKYFFRVDEYEATCKTGFEIAYSHWQKNESNFEFNISRDEKSEEEEAERV